jgi:two-component system chemotaxis response regulator CheB
MNQAKPQIRLFIVDDSAYMRAALSRMAGSDPDILVVGTASSGNEALQRIPSLDPDVITLDVQMPGMEGLEVLRRIMSNFPRPVIMVSSLTLKDAETTFNALAAGAFDYIPKQLSSTSLHILHLQDDLIAKVKAAGESRRAGTPVRKPAAATLLPTRDAGRLDVDIVAIGISTGGPKALQDIFPFFPADMPVPILVVQHMPVGFTAPFAKRLNEICAVSVLEAAHGEAVRSGAIYIAPSGSHMTVERKGSRTSINLSDQPPKQLHMPSVDVMMQSVAVAFGPLAMGIIMTGMGTDGLMGMTAIHKEGGLTVGQDEQSCTVYGMPRACAEMRILDHVVPLAQIPQEILLAVRSRRVGVS